MTRELVLNLHHEDTRLQIQRGPSIGVGPGQLSVISAHVAVIVGRDSQAGINITSAYSIYVYTYLSYITIIITSIS